MHPEIGHRHEPASPAGRVGGALLDRLAELAAINDLLDELPSREVRGHVAGVRAFLHDDVLRQAHAEEVVLFPALDRPTNHDPSLANGLVAEHDTLREATRAIDELAPRPLSRPTVTSLGNLLDATTLLLERHLTREADASEALLEALDPAERERFGADLAALDTPVTTTARAWWLPEKLPREETYGVADQHAAEGLLGASCDPGALIVTRSAAAAALEGVDAARWRRTLAEHSRYRTVITDAESCMRDAGLWPWRPGHEGLRGRE